MPASRRHDRSTDRGAFDGGEGHWHENVRSSQHWLYRRLPECFAAQSGSPERRSFSSRIRPSCRRGLAPWRGAPPQSVSPPPTEWVSPHSRDHALVGKIWSREPAGFIDPHESLIRALWQRPSFCWARYTTTPMLTLSKAGPSQIKPAGAAGNQRRSQPSSSSTFERIKRKRSHASISWNARRRGLPPTSDLFRLLDWGKSGWPARGEVPAAVPIRVAGALRSIPPIRRAIRCAPWPAAKRPRCPAEERARIMLDTPLDAPLSEALTAELKGSHCGMTPDAAIPAMSIAQRYRDAAFADAMLTAADNTVQPSSLPAMAMSALTGPCPGICGSVRPDRSVVVGHDARSRGR